MWSTLAALEEQILDAPAPRGKKTVGEVFSQDRVQKRLVEQMIEVRKDPVEPFFELLEPQMVEQLVDVPKIVFELAVSSDEAASSGERERHDRRRRCRSRRACWRSTASWDPTVQYRDGILLVKLGLLGPEQRA